MSASKARLVVAHLAQDHDHQGAYAVARALRDAGHEVVYTGPDQSPEQTVETSLQEDADAIVLVASGGSDPLVVRVIGLLAACDAADVGVVAVDPAARDSVQRVAELLG